MTDLPYSLTNQPFTLAVSRLPVSVPESDRTLLANERANVAAIALRALPGAVIFQLLIKVRGPNGEAPQPPPNIAFADMEDLLGPGDLRVGVRALDSEGRAIDIPVYASGGGGDGSFEYIAWFPLPDTDLSALEMTARWPDQGLPTRTAGLDLEAIRNASNRATEIWPA